MLNNRIENVHYIIINNCIINQYYSNYFCCFFTDKISNLNEYYSYDVGFIVSTKEKVKEIVYT